MSLESEGKEMSRLKTHIQTDRHVNIELEFCEMLTEFAILKTFKEVIIVKELKTINEVKLVKEVKIV